MDGIGLCRGIRLHWGDTNPYCERDNPNHHPKGITMAPKYPNECPTCHAAPNKPCRSPTTNRVTDTRRDITNQQPTTR